MQTAIDHAHQHHHADIVIEPRVNDQRLERRIEVTGGRRDFGDHGFENIFHAQPGFGRRAHRVVRVDADDVLDFLNHPIRLGGRQVDLVQYRHHFHA